VIHVSPPEPTWGLNSSNNSIPYIVRLFPYDVIFSLDSINHKLAPLFSHTRIRPQQINQIHEMRRGRTEHCQRQEVDRHRSNLICRRSRISRRAPSWPSSVAIQGEGRVGGGDFPLLLGRGGEAPCLVVVTSSAPDEMLLSSSPPVSTLLSLAFSRDCFHEWRLDCFFPHGIDGVGGVWAGDSARPGVTERKYSTGLSFFPCRVDPGETRPIHPGVGVTEQGLIGEEGLNRGRVFFTEVIGGVVGPRFCLFSPKIAIGEVIEKLLDLLSPPK
jgi:hypothetical protein